MPTIRRPSWRPRTIHGYQLQSKKIHDQTQIMCDPEFQYGNLTEQARQFLHKLRLTAWLIKRPEDTEHFATLIQIDSHHAENERLLKLIDSWPSPLALTPESDNDSTNGDGYIYYGRWRMSFVNGKVRSYMNDCVPDLNIDVANYLKNRDYWAGVSAEDKRALAAIEF